MKRFQASPHKGNNITFILREKQCISPLANSPSYQMANTGSEWTSVLYSRDWVLTLQISKKNVKGLGGESCYSLRLPPAPSTSLSGQPQPFLFSSQGVQALLHPRKPSCWQALAPPTWLALCSTSHAAHPIKRCTRHLFLRFPVIYPSPHLTMWQWALGSLLSTPIFHL